MTERTFEEFGETLAPLTSPEASVAPERELAIHEAIAAVDALPTIDRLELAKLVHEHPEWVPVLGLVMGLSQEQLKNQLRFHAQTSSWRRLAREDADRLIVILDSADMRIVEQLDRQRKGSYTFADVLIARAGSRERASRAISRGRQLEDLVETVVQRLNVTYEARTRFLGRGGEDAPCDFAIPEGGEFAAIVIAVKGFDSTGDVRLRHARSARGCKGVARLESDLSSGMWEERFGHIRELDALDVCYHLLVAA